MGILARVEAGESPADREVDDSAHGDVALEQRGDGVVVISLSGEHDLTTAPALRDRVREALESGSALIVDLSAADFIDSSIIGVVIEARRKADEAGVGFAASLEGGEPAVRRVLEVTGLDSNLPVHPDLETAIGATGGSGRGAG